MFRHLRSKIILSFCVLMIAGGALTTALVSGNLSRTLARSLDRNALGMARVLAAELVEPLAYTDWLEVKRILVHARRTNRDLVYLFITAPDGTVLEHSFARGSFPEDLVAVAASMNAKTLRVEKGELRDLRAPIADGVLGALHVGTSKGWIMEASGATIRNVALTTLLAMGVGILGILILSGLITRPILSLTRTVHHLGEGKESGFAPVTGHDEVAELATTFNAMTVQIRDRIEESDQLRSYAQRILDNLISGVLVITREGRIEYANGVAIGRYGDVVGRLWKDTLARERPDLMDSVQEVLEEGCVRRIANQVLAGRTYELTYVPMIGRDGTPAVVEKSLDVTEQLQMAERLRRTERLAVAGEIGAGLVHAINNPLDGVRRACQLACARPDEPQRVRDMMELADEGCGRIAEVTRTLLGFARIEEDVKPVGVDLGSLMLGAVDLVRLKAYASSVEIEVDVSSDLPLFFCDPEALKEVAINLLMNAVDACQSGGKIAIDLSRLDDENLEILVADDGEGIPSELRERVFQPFFTTKEVGRGTGLGLAVVRRIVEAHGGEIRAEARPGGGTIIRILLRFAAPAAVGTEGQ